MKKADAIATMPATCAVVRAGSSFIGKQGLSYAAAISAQTVGAQAIHMQMVTIPPGGSARAHKHAAHETALYVLSGTSAMDYGDNLEHRVHANAGDFLYIPANIPHRPFNTSDTEPCVALISRTDPNEQESVVLLPELDGKER
jgi:uncharacterized RmlC-like cupin family protein